MAKRRVGIRGIGVPYLAAYRVKRLLTQQELAEKAGLWPRTICRIEAGGNATFTTIKCLASTLGIGPEQLVEVDPHEGR